MATPYQAREFDAPPESPETAHYWQAANDGQLLYKRCDDCQEPHHYPRALCPFCGSDRTAWRQSAGQGTIYSVSVTRRGTPVPYAMAYVTLDEGVTLMTNIVEGDLDDARIGDRVEAVFVAARGGRRVPMFRRVAGARA